MSRSVYTAGANSQEQPVSSTLDPRIDRNMDPAEVQRPISQQQAIGALYPHLASPFEAPSLVPQLQPGLTTNVRTRFQQSVYIPAGSHLDLESLNLRLDALPYEHVKILGHGGTASVEMVRDVNTGMSFARKIIRNVYARNMQEAKKMLRNEVEIMKRLENHHHIIKVHATYIAKRELAIILDPVADSGDLATYLQNRRDKLTDGTLTGRDRVLEQSFGCLASGLAYMHKHTIRHKDIKPQNILIHRGSVMYTDFGLSYDYSETGRSTTTGLVQGLTKRYCAPEVANGAPRNSKSDVFSLGCVYLEVADSLYPGYIDEEIMAGPFHEKLLALESDVWPRALKDDKPHIYLLELLMSHNPSRRFSSREVLDTWGVVTIQAAPLRDYYFCAECLTPKAVLLCSGGRIGDKPLHSPSPGQ
jgi:serine/threonine protein kinase